MGKMFWCLLFGRKKLYKVVYEKIETYSTIIEAKNEFQAIRKFHRMMKFGITPSIISIEEYWVR